MIYISDCLATPMPAGETGKSPKIGRSSCALSRLKHGKAKYNSAVCGRKLSCAKFIRRLIKVTRVRDVSIYEVSIKRAAIPNLSVASVLPTETFQCLFLGNVSLLWSKLRLKYNIRHETFWKSYKIQNTTTNDGK